LVQLVQNSNTRVYNRPPIFHINHEKVCPTSSILLLPFFELRGRHPTAFRQDRRIAQDQLTTILPCRDKTEFFIGIGGSFYESARYGWHRHAERPALR
jgi:hypothetical protein